MSEFTYHDLLASLGIGGAHPGGFALTRELLQKEQLSKKSCVLDAGCGTGQTSAFLARTFGCAVTALDCHETMIEKAKRRFQNEHLSVQVVQGDLQQMPFPDESFDFLIAESVTIFTDLAQSLPEYARVLKHGGILLDLEMTAERPLSARELEDLRSVYGTRLVPTETEWMARLQGTGFHPVQIVHGASVAEALHQTPDPQAVPDMQPSPTIEPKLFDIWNAHQEITVKFSRRLGYRVYRAVKK